MYCIYKSRNIIIQVLYYTLFINDDKNTNE